MSTIDNLKVIYDSQSSWLFLLYDFPKDVLATHLDYVLLVNIDATAAFTVGTTINTNSL